MDYSEWIKEYGPASPESALGECRDVCAAMSRAFPELSMIRGHYFCPIWGERGHWWLVAPDGRVVDPTAIQFPSKGGGVYEPWTEGAEEPVGRCMNCGAYSFASTGGDHNFCSDSCAAAEAAALNAL